MKQELYFCTHQFSKTKLTILLSGLLRVKWAYAFSSRPDTLPIAVGNCESVPGWTLNVLPKALLMGIFALLRGIAELLRGIPELLRGIAALRGTDD